LPPFRPLTGSSALTGAEAAGACTTGAGAGACTGVCAEGAGALSFFSGLLEQPAMPATVTTASAHVLKTRIFTIMSSPQLGHYFRRKCSTALGNAMRPHGCPRIARSTALPGGQATLLATGASLQKLMKRPPLMERLQGFGEETARRHGPPPRCCGQRPPEFWKAAPAQLTSNREKTLWDTPLATSASWGRALPDGSTKRLLPCPQEARRGSGRPGSSRLPAPRAGRQVWPLNAAQGRSAARAQDLAGTPREMTGSIARQG